MQFHLTAQTASAFAEQWNHLWLYLLLVGVVMTVLIFAGVATFAIKYRRRPSNLKPTQIHGSYKLEIFWSIIPFLFMLVMFGWGTRLFFDLGEPPANAIDIYVTAKQWMWKIQHPEGQREIDELHIPVGRPVRVTLASEDVIHSFFIPAFRIKRDVVPGRYNQIWFTATKTGRYHLFCAEYCGTQHSGMTGWVTVMEPADYENWLAGGGAQGTMAQQGERLFTQLGCVSCHLTDAQGRCPSLRNVYGHPVRLDDGRTVLADDAYVRESILTPNAKIVAGYHKDIMPTFEGQVTEENLLQLLVYVKSLSAPAPPPTLGPVKPGAPAEAPAPAKE